MVRPFITLLAGFSSAQHCSSLSPTLELTECAFMIQKDLSGRLSIKRWLKGGAEDLNPPRCDALSTIFQFVSTFGVWVIAERIGLSPILTVVTYAMTLARSGPVLQPAYLRIPSYAVWDTAVVVLDVLAFLLIGLELGPVIAAAPAGNLGRWVVVGSAVLTTVIIVRLGWTVAAALWSERWIKHQGAAASSAAPLPSWRTGLLIGWAGHAAS